MDTKRLARIKKMEDDFNLVSEVVKSLDEALADYQSIQRRINRLTEYQESGQWLKDYEADEHETLTVTAVGEADAEETARSIIAKGVMGLDGTICKSADTFTGVRIYYFNLQRCQSRMHRLCCQGYRSRQYKFSHEKFWEVLFSLRSVFPGNLCREGNLSDRNHLGSQ